MAQLLLEMENINNSNFKQNIWCLRSHPAMIFGQCHLFEGVCLLVRSKYIVQMLYRKKGDKQFFYCIRTAVPGVDYVKQDLEIRLLDWVILAGSGEKMHHIFTHISLIYWMCRNHRRKLCQENPYCQLIYFCMKKMSVDRLQKCYADYFVSLWIIWRSSQNLLLLISGAFRHHI